MRRWRILGASLAFALCPAIFSATASAQVEGTGAIAGVVKDASGAVIPGVTVEASSPALIEKVRTSATDSSGAYRIVALSPGVYAVTFTLPGFSTVKREGLDVSASVTLNINAELRVGALTETVTVSGQGPLVDIQNTTAHNTITRGVMDDLPTARTFATIGVLVSGVTASFADVGGSAGELPTSLAIHGSYGQDMPLLFDGMRDHVIWGNGGGGGTNWVINNGIVEETSIDTSGLTAEVETSGVRVNSIPKSGGNRFSAAFFTNYANHSMQSNNLTPDLIARGARSADATDHVWDTNPGVGGPIKKDTLWFYFSYRDWGTELLPAATYYNADPTGISYVPDLSRPVHAPLWSHSTDVRFTWQTSAKSKAGFFGARNDRCWCAILAASTFPYEATLQFTTPTSYLYQGTWNWTITNRLLFDVGWTYHAEHFEYGPQPDIPQNRPSIYDLDTGVFHGSAPQFLNYGQRTHASNGRAAVSYVTGSHSLKVGSQWFFGPRDYYQRASGNKSYLFLAGAPVAVTYYNTPVTAPETLNMNFGLFAQEQWTRKRLTVNAGVRFDYLNGQNDGASLAARPYAPAVSYERIPNLPNWKDISTRWGLSYDLFGNGKTALKWNLGRYVEGQAIGIAAAVDPLLNAAAASDTRQWNDLFYPVGDPRRGNFSPDCDAFDHAANGECGPSSNLAFGGAVSPYGYAPSTVTGWGTRGYNWETMVGVEHEVRPGLSVDASYHRRWFGNFRIVNNLATPTSAYDTYCITAPIDARLPGGGGYQLCGLADIKPQFYGLNNTQIDLAKRFGKESLIFDGIDLNAKARLPGGVMLQGGVSTGRQKWTGCFATNSPQAIAVDFNYTIPFPSYAPNLQPEYCHVTPPFQPLFRFLGTYPLPWASIRVSATYQSNPGPNIIATYAVPNAVVEPSLGRPLSGGAQTASVQLVPPGVLYGERMHQVDFRLAKEFRVGRAHIQPQFDLYNLLNGNYVQALNNTYGTDWQRPAGTFGVPGIMQGRLAKVGVQVNF